MKSIVKFVSNDLICLRSILKELYKFYIYNTIAFLYKEHRFNQYILVTT